MSFIAVKKNVEYDISEKDIQRFLADGCTIYEKRGTALSIYKAPAGKEDLKNRVKELEATVAELKKQSILQESKIVALTAENTDLKKENRTLTAKLAVEETEAPAKKSSRKKAAEE